MSKTAAIFSSIVVLAISALLIFFIMNSSALESFDVVDTEEGEAQTEQPADRDTRINEILAGLDDNAKAGQLFLARVPETNQIEDIQTYHLGGYLIFGRDVEGETVDTLTQKISSWQQASSLPLFIASDEEGGEVTRVSPLLETAFKSPGELYNTGGIEALVTDAREKSSILKGMGINYNLAPVADVAVNPNSFIYNRTLTLDETTNLVNAADITADYVSQVVIAMKEAGLGCCLKHFPGYGENADSHTGIVYDEKDLATFEEVDLIPFRAGISAGAGSVLISHNIAVAFDSTQPASLSPAVHQVLRDELGFTGVIVTDDFDMEGLTDYTDQVSAAITTINAGTDLIISSTYADQIPAVVEAVQDGTIPRERFEEAVRHVIGFKYDLGLL